MLLLKLAPMMLKVQQLITTTITMTLHMPSNTIRSEFVDDTINVGNDNTSIQYLVTMASMTHQ